MNLLAIETSTERLSIAVFCGDRVCARDVDAGQRHSELALPLMHALLAEAELEFRQIDAVAFGQGPGSFTGVRIACGLAQGLAFGCGKGVLPVATQLALAEQTGAARVMVAIDARMGEIYFAAYEQDADSVSGWRTLVAPRLATCDALPTLPLGECCATGSAFDVPALNAAIAARYGRQIKEIRYGMLPRAADVATLAARQLRRAGMESAIHPAHAAPLYLRNHVAMTIEERRQHHAAKALAAVGGG